MWNLSILLLLIWHLIFMFLAFVGSYPPSVSNSLKASKLVSNEVVDEIQEFKDRYFAHVINLVWLFLPGLSY